MNNEQYERYMEKYLNATTDTERRGPTLGLKLLARFAINELKRDMGIVYSGSSQRFDRAR